MDHLAELRTLSTQEKTQSLNLKLQLQQIATAEEISWRQKSRCLWLKEGDKNRKFFQRMANSYRRGNSIDRLRIGDELIEDKGRIQNGILEYYQQIYKEAESWRPSAVFENMSTLSIEEKEELELPFTELEISNALMACAPDKAPGPDGYTMAFFQKSWCFIKEDLAAFNFFHQNCQMVRSCNASFIALIPKKKGAVELKDYRPISLIGSVYKLLAKILAERMKRVMNSLVSGQQSAFLKNRQITDASLIANEVLDWRIKSGESGILCKLDIEKAFDQLNWAYLVNILKQMGFGDRWIRGYTSAFQQ